MDVTDGNNTVELSSAEEKSVMNGNAESEYTETFPLSIKLQFPKFSRGFKAEFFSKFVKKHIGEENLLAIGRLSFPNEWQMVVRSKEIREKLIRLGRTKIKMRTCWITPLNIKEVRGFIHWLPNEVSNDEITKVLKKYGKLIFIENCQKSTFQKENCGSRYFSMELSESYTMHHLPHFQKICDYNTLITIKGRKPACFLCKQVGHLKVECRKYRVEEYDYLPEVRMESVGHKGKSSTNASKVKKYAKLDRIEKKNVSNNEPQAMLSRNDKETDVIESVSSLKRQIQPSIGDSSCLKNLEKVQTAFANILSCVQKEKDNLVEQSGSTKENTDYFQTSARVSEEANYYLKQITELAKKAIGIGTKHAELEIKAAESGLKLTGTTTEATKSEIEDEPRTTSTEDTSVALSSYAGIATSVTTNVVETLNANSTTKGTKKNEKDKSAKSTEPAKKSSKSDTTSTEHTTVDSSLVEIAVPPVEVAATVTPVTIDDEQDANTAEGAKKN